MTDHVLNWMQNNNLPMLVSTYLELAYMGEVKSLDELGPEDAAEVESLIEDGILHVETSGSERIQ